MRSTDLPCIEPACSFESSPARAIPRRQWLAGAISLAAIAGCQNERGPSPAGHAPLRSDVPLRVVWVGNADEAETLKRTWSSISEQPLDVRVVASPRQVMAGGSSGDSATGDSRDADSRDADSRDAANVTAELIRQSASADVLIYPLAMMSELMVQKRLMPLLENPVSTGEDVAGQGIAGNQITGQGDGGESNFGTPDVFASTRQTSLPVAMRVATTYSGERMAVPLGGHLPAMLSGEGVDEGAVKTWDDYEALVQSSGGLVCEPTAPGWAAAMYLWRLASSLTATWLFDRESLDPLFDEPEYVAVLEQMARTVKRSRDAEVGRSPTKIYDAVSRGELQGGIGFVRSGERSGPETEDASDAETLAGIVTVRFSNLPVASRRLANETFAEMRMDPVRWMVDPFMLAGSLAASCRQSAAADAFLDWIAGGQGSGPLYRNIAPMIDTTNANSESSNEPIQQYRTWLRRQLASTSFVTTLQIPGATEYYAALDQVVRSCVHGQTSAKDACAEMAERWSRLHRKYDLPAQQRAWRRAQGSA